MFRSFIDELISNLQLDFAMKDLEQLSYFWVSKFDGDPLLDPSEYHHTVGALQYITLTRPNIAYSVNQLCQTYASPNYSSLDSSPSVSTLFEKYSGLGLLYKPGSFAINAYCDSDWAGDPDDRHSTCGLWRWTIIFVREKVAHRDIILEHISTSIQPANIFTKGHTADRFCFLCDKLAIYDLPTSLRETVSDKDNRSEFI
ncbi:putative mitochondrial protein [Vitis vinifera]|uniref:Putative mitochondrial protein n=1 Tax=Vitis vinifera TaxID=29760 RepID=A0A438BQA1_VITVI|nr:putative mitochondrial protein [Vitis vinifera]